MVARPQIGKVSKRAGKPARKAVVRAVPKSAKRNGQGDPFAKRRARYRDVLARFGLADRFAALPPKLQELAMRFKAPDPQVAFDESVPDAPEFAAVRREATAALAAATVDLVSPEGDGPVDRASNAGGGPMPVRDFFGVVYGLIRVGEYERQSRRRTPLTAFMAEVIPPLRAFFDRHNLPAVKATFHAVRGPTLAHGRIETRLLYPRLGFAGLPGRQGVLVTVGAVVVPTRRVTIDAAPRLMYRVPVDDVPVDGGRVDPSWLAWPAATLGLEGDDLPVYVQAHALRNLDLRVNLPAAAPYLQAWLADALARPTVAARSGPGGRDLLIEFRVGEHRLGYLVARLAGRAVAVRTFKFLTMAGTPEGDRIERRLGLLRRDAEWLGLHDLAAFTRTDLRRDRVLRPLLDECGCAHLFDVEDADCAAAPRPLAADVRKYLRLAA